MKIQNRTWGLLAVMLLLFAAGTWLALIGDRALPDGSPEQGGPVTAARISPSNAPIASASQNRDAADTPAERTAPAWETPSSQPPFAQFAEWVHAYEQAAPAEKPALELRGIELARLRRDVLAEMIRNDPEQALKMAAPVRVRKALPAEIASLLEERVSARGELAVLAALSEPGKDGEVVPLFRRATIKGVEYEAFVYGRREGVPTRSDIPINGIAVGRLLAVNDNPARVLEPEEISDARLVGKAAACPVSGKPVEVDTSTAAVDVGGEILFLCGTNHIQVVNEQNVAAEGSGPTGGLSSQDVAASAWTEGVKKMILIRVDFPDLVGISLTETGAGTLVTNLHNFFNEMSYGRAGFEMIGNGSDVTPIFRMTNSASWYGTNNYYNALRSEARAAATAAGYVLGNYSHDVICMGPVPGFGWAGLAYVGAAGAWLRNSFGTGVAAHELGHNWGLNHANYWDTGGQSILGPGTSVEYGDSFDTMGSASAGNNHFNARYKSYVNWLQTNETITATTSGTYRITAHDNFASTGYRGLRIVESASTNYWIEFRQKFTSNKWLMNGAGLRTAQSGNQRSQLLDFTPGSTDGKNDACIVIGRTYADPSPGIYITPVAKGGTSPESLDVVVNLGTFPTNGPPEVTVAADSTNAATGVTLNFTASATDTNGDVLAYYWDFGDGNFGSNQPAASKSWSSAGEYVVRCTVSDMRGGQASDSVVVRIGSPTTFRLSGIVTDLGTPVQGARVYVSTTRMTYTDTDGTYNLTGLPAGTYTVAASLYPLTFIPSVSFTNPVVVGPSRTNIDFVSALILPPVIVTNPLSQTVNPGSNVTFTVAATGTAPLKYQWRFNAVNISGATNTTYVRLNAQPTNAGSYSVVVSNAAGTATSANAVLTVNTPPSITTQPQSQTVIAGSNATFSVVAGGSTPLTYQWRLNGTNLAGATSSAFTQPNAQLVHAGGYSVLVSNMLGMVTSSVATLTVNFGLNVSATAGGSVSKNPNQSSYAPGSVVTITAVQLSAFPFSGWTGDANGTNNPLVITVTNNMTIVAQFTSPVPDLIVDNIYATFSGNWTTSTSPSDKFDSDYRYAGSAANSASATATFTPTFGTAGRYDVYSWFPTISKPSASVPHIIVYSGGTLTSSVNQTTGMGGWVLLASGLQFAQGTSGYARIANNVGQGGKNVAADALRWVYSPVQDSVPPAFASQPQSQAVNQGGDVSFTANVTGTAPLTWQWLFNATNIAGANSAELLLTNVQPSTAGNYSLIVSNASGSVTSSTATLTVLGAPFIAAQPAGISAGVGSNLFFTVGAGGASPITYRWKKDDEDLADGGAISGSATATLNISGVLPPDAGPYSVVISNAYGSITSAPVALVVGYESDVASRPHGDNSVGASDGGLIGQWIAGLNTPPAAGHEFVRADSAPRISLGDGILSLVDWVQAGRYAAGLDAQIFAGGPVGGVASAASSPPQAAGTREIRLNGGLIARGHDGEVPVQFTSEGGENAVAFSVNFDPAELTYKSIVASGATTDAVLIVNSTDAAFGSLGIVLGRPAGLAFPPGTGEVLRITFTAAEAAPATANLTLGDTPVLREIASVTATQQPAAFADGLITFVAPVPISVAVGMYSGAARLTLTGNPWEQYWLLASTNLADWVPLARVTNINGTVEIDDPDASSLPRRFYGINKP